MNNFILFGEGNARCTIDKDVHLKTQIEIIKVTNREGNGKNIGYEKCFELCLKYKEEDEKGPQCVSVEVTCIIVDHNKIKVISMKKCFMKGPHRSRVNVTNRKILTPVCIILIFSAYHCKMLCYKNFISFFAVIIFIQCTSLHDSKNLSLRLSQI